jgi:two-component system, OmpR family, alkaline phosphatase synthesis response regulator PhoP
MMKDKSILVIEDEEEMRRFVKYNLSKEGYKVTTASCWKDALKFLKTQLPDLFLLDVVLPDTDGLNICKILKSNPSTQNIPVIMVTGKSDEFDIYSGFELGADDYVTKPYSIMVLLARIKNVFKKSKSSDISDNNPIIIHDLEINPTRHEICQKGKALNLTYLEFRVLHLFATYPGRVFTRYQIIEAVRGDDHLITDRSVDVMIVGLRKKLGSKADYIETVWGVGYRFKE